ncbi:MAG: 50S ribosomal protein L7/L12 [Candidatus Muiribacterium halophilum]|uniref:Large ribosomal subunit protein bL12 n=1 Tax=Muiribacterium halophilum TaxID=2053465 RepID=A0A2N5ZGS3_MUIH1|nr:MAG: 50S ribosomal protein L7/L12 [Candidatus Muirbacterium halophilum]
MTHEEILNEIEKMSVLDLVELVKAAEDKFGVSASAPVAMAAMPMAGGAAEEEKTEFDVVLAGFDAAKKLQVIKTLREITGLGIKEAKAAVDEAPKAIKESVTKEEAEETKAKLEAAGGKVELK